MSAAITACRPEHRAAEAALRAAIREVLQTDGATLWMLAGIVGARRDHVRRALAQLEALGEAASNGHASEALRVWRIVMPSERTHDAINGRLA